MKLYGFGEGATINTVSRGDTALHRIVRGDVTGKEEMLQVILEKDSENMGNDLPSIINELNSSDFTALYLAVIHEETEMVRLLFKHGADDHKMLCTEQKQHWNGPDVYLTVTNVIKLWTF